MNNKYLKQSIVLHLAVILLFYFDMPDFWHEDLTMGEAPIIVDLSQVRIDEFTNLPTKAEFGPEDRKATVEKKTEQYTPPAEPEPEPEIEKNEIKNEPEPTPQPVKEKPTEVKQDFLEAPVPENKPEKKPEPKPTPKRPPVPAHKPKPKPKPKPQPKPEPKKTEPAKNKTQEQSNVKNNALKDLLREIDNNQNVDLGEKTQSAMIKEGTQVNNMGIEGGKSEGSFFSDLTISETDAIASLLASNWNLDPGAIGIDGMVVPIRVYLARDGSIQKIEFIEQSRFNADPSYRSVAESAQRAVYATQQVFKDVFGGKYADTYNAWRTLKLYFDPLNKGVH